ncbi:MAG: hypothetical protein JSR86_05155 [Proteobacteria bacterium]|nr:hypothetical protein [Pseudomonadota bacterium]
MRSLERALGAAALCAVLVQSVANAADAHAPPSAPPAASSAHPGSNFVQCDGEPRQIKAAEAAADIALITGSLGLYGLLKPIETGDKNKRLAGAEGVAACERALTEDTTNLRRAQVVLARAIHHIEAKQYDEAVADAHAAEGVAGETGKEPGYQASLGLTASEIEAMALLRKGDAAGAERAALAMALASPYDVNATIRANRYAQLTPVMTPEKRRYFEQAVRLQPGILLQRASARQWDGDFTGAAADMGTLFQAYHVIRPEEHVLGPATQQAVILALAGDVKASDALAAQIGPWLDEDIKAGKVSATDAAPLDELLEFRAIAVQLAEGKVHEARAAFAAHSRWLAAWPVEDAYLTERLRAAADPSELKGALARDPVEMRKADFAATAAAAVGQPDAQDKLLYGSIRPYIGTGDYRALSGGVWKTDKSRYLWKRTGKETYQGEAISFIGVPTSSLVVVSEAALMHAALIAQSRGKAAFVLAPARTRLDFILVIFGDPGDAGFPAAAAFDAKTVIADLSPIMPKPNP